jgi:hypothetical protein
MTTPPEWDEQGCEVCRGQWMTGQHPHRVAVNATMHETLYRCSVCGTFWVETERYATAIDPGTAKTTFGEGILDDA